MERTKEEDKFKQEKVRAVQLLFDDYMITVS